MKKRPPRFPKDEVLSQDEQTHRLENFTLKRAEAILKERATYAELTKTEKRRVLTELEKTHLPKRCRECGAMKFYLKNGKPKK